MNTTETLTDNLEFALRGARRDLERAETELRRATEDLTRNLERGSNLGGGDLATDAQRLELASLEARLRREMLETLEGLTADDA